MTTAAENPVLLQSKTKAPLSSSRDFLSDVETLRSRARKQIDDGAVTGDYGIDPALAAKVLNAALSTELICVLRYRHHYFVARGLSSEPIAQEFLTHSNEELGHADRIAQRIVQLGGSPEMDPGGLASRSHAEYVTPSSLTDMIRENLVAERIAIESYREMIAFFGERDPTTRAMLEGILAVEEEHANELADLLV
ncbi:MAG TPA: ferritin-like domain-containing protein [Rhodocyclaceae bacterium]|nr:ferritin-like domain-containing protein [Rhodocyclaceae bacterium]